MKIVRIIGGLGNQLFQYAFLIALRQHSGDKVKLDLSPISTYGLHNGFELQRIFNITASVASKAEVQSLGRYYSSYTHWRICHHLFPIWKKEFVEKKFEKYYPQLLTHTTDDKIYDGYWQCHQYFDDVRDEILKEFTYKTVLDERNGMCATKMLSDAKSVSIHIRRGDYLKKKIYRGIADLDYYKRAIVLMRELLGEEVNVYVFSNDQEWCKTNIQSLLEGTNYLFIDWNTGNDSYKDMRLMSQCRLNILAASSFSWWGAYLNERDDKIAIAPKKWINTKMEYQIQLPEWILT